MLENCTDSSHDLVDNWLEKTEHLFNSVTKVLVNTNLKHAQAIHLISFL